MTLTLEDTQSGVSVRLWNAQQRDSATNVPETVLSPVGLGDNEAIITALQQGETITLTGTTVGVQLVRETGAADPVQAAAEWTAQFEEFVNPAPGNASIRLVNTNNSRTVSVTPESLAWQRNQGAPDTVEWDLTLQVGGGIDADTGISTPTVTAGGDDAFDSIVLPNVQQRRVERSVEVSEIRRVLADGAEDNEQIIESGGERRITITGRVEGSAVDQSSFADRIKARAGNDETHPFASAFPGRTLQAAIASFNSTREAGRTAEGDYTLSLVGGQSI